MEFLAPRLQQLPAAATAPTPTTSPGPDPMPCKISPLSALGAALLCAAANAQASAQDEAQGFVAGSRLGLLNRVVWEQ
ncbi:hypothetical protein, partial [Escherichia coli]|uniref:hypothetical protein n=1 Tax=Escherichia coli TaxID=562 RepID=UPI00194E53D7